MKKYLFIIDERIKTKAQLRAGAESADEAARLIRAELRKNKFVVIAVGRRGDGDLPPLEFLLDLEDGIEVLRLAGEETRSLADDLLVAARRLEEAGYDYQRAGGAETLALDENPHFMKPVWTEDGAGVDAFLHVRGDFDTDAGVHRFRIEAILYPTGRGDLRRGEAPFRVRFEDKQHFIGAAELPLAIEVYETKFLELINLLRNNTTPNM